MTSRRGQRSSMADRRRSRRPGRTGLLANRIRRDEQAVTNGLTLPWSSAAVDGNGTKIKMLKRQMCGRARRFTPGSGVAVRAPRRGVLAALLSCLPAGVACIFRVLRRDQTHPVEGESGSRL